MQYNRPTACVIALQYSSVTFISLRFRYCKEKFGVCLKNVVSELYFFKLRKSKIA
jgi:hypothetical protein